MYQGRWTSNLGIPLFNRNRSWTWKLKLYFREMLRIDIIGGGVGSTASGGTLAKVESYIWEREAALHCIALICTVLYFLKIVK